MTLDLRAILGNALAARYASQIAAAEALAPIWQQATGREYDHTSVRRMLKRYVRNIEGGEMPARLLEATIAHVLPQVAAQIVRLVPAADLLAAETAIEAMRPRTALPTPADV